jgi:rhodanese-related sulfurtransferase
MKQVDCNTLKQWIDKGDVFLIDVREPDEHAAIRIQGAYLVPLSDFDIDRIKAFKEKHIVIHCKAGVRGEKACKKVLAEMPHLDVFNLEGGIDAWTQAGLSTLST